jgi:hypothetical protein
MMTRENADPDRIGERGGQPENKNAAKAENERYQEKDGNVRFRGNSAAYWTDRIAAGVLSTQAAAIRLHGSYDDGLDHSISTRQMDCGG